MIEDPDSSSAAIILKVYRSNENPNKHWTSFYRELRALRAIDSKGSSTHEEKRLLGFDQRNMLIVTRQIRGTPIDEHLASLLDRPEEIARLRPLFTNLASEFHSKYRLIHGQVSPANVIYKLASDIMTLNDFGMTSTLEQAAKNGWSLSKDIQRSEFEFDLCVGMHDWTA